MKGINENAKHTQKFSYLCFPMIWPSILQKFLPGWGELRLVHDCFWGKLSTVLLHQGLHLCGPGKQGLSKNCVRFLSIKLSSFLMWATVIESVQHLAPIPFKNCKTNSYSLFRTSDNMKLRIISLFLFFPMKNQNETCASDIFSLCVIVYFTKISVSCDLRKHFCWHYSHDFCYDLLFQFIKLLFEELLW